MKQADAASRTIPDRLARVLAGAVVITLPLLLVLVEWAAATTPGYSRVGQTISELSAPGVPHPLIIRAAFTTNGLLVLALGVAVARALGASAPGRLVALFLLLYGTAYMVSGLFPDDSERVVWAGLTENLVHDLTAQAGVGAIMAALVCGAWATRGTVEAWPGVAGYALVALAVDSVLLVPLLADWWESYHGLFERAMFLGTLAWVELLAYRVYQATGPYEYHGHGSPLDHDVR